MGRGRRVRVELLVTALLAFALAACSTGSSPKTAPKTSPESSLSLSATSAPASSASQTSPATSASAAGAGLSMVVLGDSIPYNSPQDCPGCKGFVELYAAALQRAAGRHVVVQNLSEHNGLTLPQLLAELPSFQGQLKSADAILIGIAHNSNELASETPCGKPLDAHQLPVWSVMTSACASKSVATYRRQYDKLFHQVAGWRTGKPTLLRTINRYDDYRGDPDFVLRPADLATITTFVSTWDVMLCASARAASFGCADVYHAFNGRDGHTPSSALVGPDYTHPSAKGNALIARVLIGMGFSPLA
jgi:lysophospholipase L1-like esterase